MVILPSPGPHGTGTTGHERQSFVATSALQQPAGQPATIRIARSVADSSVGQRIADQYPRWLNAHTAS